MFSWWDSLEAVAKFNLWMQWLAAILAILAGLCGVLILVSGSRIDALRAKQNSQAKEQSEAREAELQRRLEIAENHTKELQEHQKSRTLSSEQRTKLLDLLRSNPTGKMQVASINGDAEASDFAREIVEVLRKANWQVVFSSVSLGALIPKGLLFQYFQVLAEETPAEEASEEVPADVVLLRQVLSKIDIPTGEDRVLKCPAKMLKRMKEEWGGAAALIVGRKP